MWPSSPTAYSASATARPMAWAGTMAVAFKRSGASLQRSPSQRLKARHNAAAKPGSISSMAITWLPMVRKVTATSMPSASMALIWLFASKRRARASS